MGENLYMLLASVKKKLKNSSWGKNCIVGRSEDDEGGDVKESVKETCMGALYNECWEVSSCE